MPRNRRLLLSLSVVVSLALHALLFYAAPRVSLLRPAESADDIYASVQVNLLTEAPPIPANDADADTLGNPEGLGDLLDEPVFEPPQEPLGMSEEEALDAQLAAEALARDHDLMPDDAVLETIDAQILAITEEEARENVEITRTLARAESTRILDENEFPTLRGPVDMLQEEVVLIDPLQVGASDATGDSPAARGTAADRPESAPPPPGLPELPEEEMLARRTVIDAVARESSADVVDEMVQFELATYVPPGDPRGFFRLRIVPRADQSLPVLPKDVTFVIDSSSSIMQRKLDLTARGLADALKALRPEDRFNVIVFRDTPNAFQAQPVPATPETRDAAVQFLNDLQSRGETDVYNAIRPVIQNEKREGVPNIVWVITDGRPTTGLKNGQMIINALTEDNDFSKSIFAFSAGRTVNRYLLDLLAYRNKGESFYLEEIEAMDDALPEYFQELSDPLLVEVNTVFGRVDSGDVYPRELPDFYRSRAVTVYGRYNPAEAGDFFVRMTGQAGEASKEVIFRADLADASRGGPEIARGWAFRKIYHLIAEMSRVGETPDLLAEVRELSRQYNIQTIYSD